MGLWTDLVTRPSERATYSDINNFWYQPLATSFPSLAGSSVTPYTALKTSAVWACVWLLARTQAMLPAIVYRDREDGGKERNHRHPVAKVLRKWPNRWQSRFEYRQYGMTSLLLTGNFYSLMRVDGRGALIELVPLAPERVRPEQLESGRIVYHYRPPQGPARTYSQDDISHIRHLSLDGVVGVSPIEFARETIGRGLAQSTASAALYANAMEPRTVITGPRTLSPTARKSLKEDLADKTGAANTGKTLLLEEDFKIQQLSLSPRDAQYVESSYITIEDICRAFGVPPHMVQHLLRSTNNNIEQQSLEYVTYALMPWNACWEAAADRDYFVDGDDHHLEFLVDMLLKGDTLSRYQAHAIGISNGFIAENEARIRENFNPWPGLWEPKRSVNQGRGGGTDNAPRRPAPAPAPAEDDETDDDAAMGTIAPSYHPALRAAADRLVRKEAAAIVRQAERGRLERAWAAEFYGRYVLDLIETLCLDQDAARRYGAEHCERVLHDGTSVLREWAEVAPARLVDMAMAIMGRNGHHAHV